MPVQHNISCVHSWFVEMEMPLSFDIIIINITIIVFKFEVVFYLK